MYCVQCGTNNTETTRFCTRCGENLEAMRQALMNPSGPLMQQALIGPKHVGLILILSFILSLGGLGIIFGTITGIVLNTPNGINQGLPFFLALGGITGLCFIISRMLKMIPRTTSAPVQQQSAPLKDALSRAIEQRVLPAPQYSTPVPPPSIVEHTTARLQDHAPQDYGPPRREDPNRA